MNVKSLLPVSSLHSTLPWFTLITLRRGPDGRERRLNLVVRCADDDSEAVESRLLSEELGGGGEKKQLNFKQTIAKNGFCR